MARIDNLQLIPLLSSEAATKDYVDTHTLSGVVPISSGGTGQTTAQAAINALTQVESATNEYILTKDTSTGNALWKAPPASGIQTIGTINSQTKSANGLVISGTTLYAQTADATYPGLVSTDAQTFAGDKTFSGNINIPTTTITVGYIKQNSVNFIHTYGNNNISIGSNAGSTSFLTGVNYSNNLVFGKNSFTSQNLPPTTFYYNSVFRDNIVIGPDIGTNGVNYHNNILFGINLSNIIGATNSIIIGSDNGKNCPSIEDSILIGRYCGTGNNYLKNPISSTIFINNLSNSSYYLAPRQDFTLTPSSSGGNMETGTGYRYAISWVWADTGEESALGYDKSCNVTGPTGSVTISNIKTNIDGYACSARKIYRAHAYGSNTTTVFHLVGTINDNTTTTFVDTRPNCIVSGDTNSQTSNWEIYGNVHARNSNNGILYWTLTNSSGTRTVNVYCGASATSPYQVMTGSLLGNGQINLSSVNNSGLTGKVTVAYTTDDTDVANNTLDFGALPPMLSGGIGIFGPILRQNSLSIGHSNVPIKYFTLWGGTNQDIIFGLIGDSGKNLIIQGRNLLPTATGEADIKINTIAKTFKTTYGTNVWSPQVTRLTIGTYGGIGFGTNAYGSNIRIYNSNLDFSQSSAPSSTGITLTLNAGSNLGIGTYHYAMSVVGASSREIFFYNGQITTTAGNQSVIITLPTALNPQDKWTAIKIYRTPVNGSAPSQYRLLTTIDNFYQTSYTDNIADGSLGGVIDVEYYYRPKNYAGGIYYNNDFVAHFGGPNDNTVAIGYQSARSLKNRYTVTAIGHQSLASITSGAYCTAIGERSAYSLTTGNYNTAIGYNSLYSCVAPCNDNISIGSNTLYSATSAGQNIAIGNNALYSITNLSENIAIGHSALYSLNINSANTVIGYRAVYGNRLSGLNTIIGWSALETSVSGYGNTILGHAAGRNVYNTIECVGLGCETFQNAYVNFYNIAIGKQAFYYLSAQQSNISSFADAGDGKLNVTSNSHGLTGGEQITIYNSTNYNGTYTITYINANTFQITKTYVSNESNARWFRTEQAQHSVAIGFNAGYHSRTGKYNVYIGSGSGPTNNNGIYDNQITLGYQAIAYNLSNTTVIGNSSMVNWLPGGDNTLEIGRVDGTLGHRRIKSINTVDVKIWPGTTYKYTIKSATLTADRTLIFPDSNGTSGQVLTTNGSGVLSWTTPTGGLETIGTIDSQPKSSNGGVASGGALYFQTADATYPGLVSTSTQTFAGQKIFPLTATNTPSHSATSSEPIQVGGYTGIENIALGIYGATRGVLLLGGNYTTATTDVASIKFLYGPKESGNNENTASIAYISARTLTTDSTSGGDLCFGTKATSGTLVNLRWTISSTGQFIQDTTNGNNIVFSKELTGITSSGVNLNLFNGYAAGSTIITGGTTVGGAAEHAYIALRGPDYGGSGEGGRVLINAGTGTGGAVVITYNNLERWIFNSSGQFVQNATYGGDIVYNKIDSSIRAGTSDNSDTLYFAVLGGGAMSTSRGAEMKVFGNENVNFPGNAQFRAGNVANGNTIIETTHDTSLIRIQTPTTANNYVILNSNVLYFQTGGNRRWWVDSSGNLISDVTYGGDLVLKNSGGVIRLNTSDGSDTSGIELNAGGGTGADRGAYIKVHGNEHATSPGRLNLYSGNVAGGNIDIETFNNISAINIKTPATSSNNISIDSNTIYFKINGTNQWFISNSGDLITNPSSRAIIHLATIDGSDTKSLQINGGGASGNARGGFIEVYGNEHSTNPGKVIINAGDVTGGSVVEIWANNTKAMSIGPTGVDFYVLANLINTGVNLPNDFWYTANNSASGVNNLLKSNASDFTLLNAPSGKSIEFQIGETTQWYIRSDGALVPNVTSANNIIYTSPFTIRANTSDGSDDKQLLLTGGGSWGYTRGASLRLSGNEHANAGSAYLEADGAISLSAGYTTGSWIEFRTVSQLRWYIEGSGYLVQAANGSDIVFNRSDSILRMGTSDGSDNKRLILTGGGAWDAAYGRGAHIELSGNEASNPGSMLCRANGVIWLSAQNKVSFETTGNPIEEKTHSAFTGSESKRLTRAIRTTDASTVDLYNLALADNTTYYYEVKVIGRLDSTIAKNYWVSLEFCVRRNNGSAATLVGTRLKGSDSEGNPTWTCDVNTNGNNVRVQVSGAVSENVNWVAKIDYQAVSGNS